MAAPKRKADRRIVHTPDAPAAVQAVNLALQILKSSGANSWRDLARRPEAHEHIILTDAQQTLLDEHMDVLPYLSIKPMRTIFVCRVCGRLAFADAAPPPARCTITLGCGGSVMKASTVGPRATTVQKVLPPVLRAPAPSDPIEPSDEPITVPPSALIGELAYVTPIQPPPVDESFPDLDRADVIPDRPTARHHVPVPPERTF
ncbi:hypothetical protein [Rathayibacter rathayi]|uniref:hypothetical protein n=1 Tax=Rathayibacter rathayi TaxID=33887 RepID=UPI000CE87152|nr:hypothetical protein [Rathayibacter rathayi]PPG14380.1 hypothetical protein C5C11_04915 [Rathayibacter rathayi]